MRRRLGNARAALRGVVLAVLVAGTWTVLAVPAWADSVRLSAAMQDGYGRMTFRWPQPVGHQASVSGNRLVVNFSRPIEADLRPALRNLSAYIAAIEPAPNEASVAFRLTGGFQVRSYDSGASVIVDIVGPVSQGQDQGQDQTQTARQAEPQPQAPQQPPQQGTVPTSQEVPSVPVRTGVHDAYSRIVFDWPSDTAFALARDGGRAVLTFDKAARVNLAGLAAGRVRNVGGAAAELADGKLVVTLNADPTSRINAFTSGPKVVVDVYAPGTRQAIRQATPQQTQSQAQAPAQAPPRVEATPQPAAPEPPAPEPAPVAAVETAPASTTPSGPVALTPPQPEAAAPAPEPAAPSPGQAPAAPSAQAQAPSAPVDLGPPINSRAQASVQGEGAVAVRFDWSDPVGAAVFRRGDVLWVAFDRRANIDTAAMVQDGAGLITSAEQVPSNLGTVLRLTTAEGVNPDIKRSGLAWILEFLEQPLFPSAPLRADAQPNSPLGARLFVSVPEPGNVIAFRDPEVGDNLMVVPVIPLGHGVSRPWTYPQLHILPSKQGVVVKPVSDDIRVRPLRQGVEMTSAGTLQISSVSAEEKANVELEAALAASAGMESFRPLTRVLDLEKWKRADLQDFISIRQDLQRDIAFAKNTRQKDSARRELLQFYFTNGFEAEALGVMTIMVAENPELEKQPEFLMLRGAANWLMGRLEDARTGLFNPILDGTDEAAFWRAAVVAKEGHMEEAVYDLRRTGAITQPYPKSLKMPTATLVADAALELGDVKQATQYLDVLAVDDPSEAQRNQIDYVAGKLKELSGDPDGAIADWERVMEGVHRPSRAKAAVARTELLLKQGHFTPDDAIEEFEKLRFVWRGDDFEFALLRRLGNLYLDQGKYREGLSTLRQAATHFPEHEALNQVTKKMSDTFKWLYLENGADALAPVTAIALYDEFRELTPAGKEGDEMIRKLADRLVQVDLLGRAADLLESQVDFRLVGEERARVGARLALIYLFDRRFEHALNALNKTQATNITEELARQRMLLRARVLIGLEQPEQALELVRTETGLEVERIRADIYWKAGDWKEASRALNRVVKDLEAKPRQPLNDKQALAVLSLAVAYTLDQNETAVSRLVANFGPAMTRSPFADAYQLITTGPEPGLINFRQLDEAVKTVDDFQAFMQDYRQRVAEGQLSSLY